MTQAKLDQRPLDLPGGATEHQPHKIETVKVQVDPLPGAIPPEGDGQVKPKQANPPKKPKKGKKEKKEPAAKAPQEEIPMETDQQGPEPETLDLALEKMEKEQARRFEEEQRALPRYPKEAIGTAAGGAKQVHKQQKQKERRDPNAPAPLHLGRFPLLLGSDVNRDPDPAFIDKTGEDYRQFLAQESAMFDRAAAAQAELRQQIGGADIPNAGQMGKIIRKMTEEFPKLRQASDFHRAIASDFERRAQNYMESFQTSVNDALQTTYLWEKGIQERAQKLQGEVEGKDRNIEAMKKQLTDYVEEVKSANNRVSYYQDISVQATVEKEQTHEKLAATETMLQQKMDEVNDLKRQLERCNKELADAREDVYQSGQSASLWCDKANWALRRLSDEDRALRQKVT